MTCKLNLPEGKIQRNKETEERERHDYKQKGKENENRITEKVLQVFRRSGNRVHDYRAAVSGL
jgi:hypothetical protein